ncbi:MAG TPA: GNAT family N-acetyltransferase [Ktedonobacterales bacterium]|nr:GNAT family N-acetyltransferase [Ktedonobacterales bacterium]
MDISMRPLAGPRDLQRIYDFTQAFAADAFHMVDLPYRLCTPSAQEPENARLWEDEQGHLRGFAIVQLPWLTVDYVIHPAARAAGLEETMLAWMLERWPQVMAEHKLSYSLFLEVREDQTARLALLERLGFVRDDWHTLHMSQPLHGPLPAAQPLEGFTIRPLAGEDEVAGYVALHRAAFGSNNMTVDWRARTLEAPQYIPSLDLVAAAADGSLAALCVGWLSQRSHDENGGNTGQVEPIGVRPDLQQRGLGRAMLLEGLRRLRAHGATTALIDSDGENDPAHSLYTSVGFRVANTVRKYRKDF